MLFTDAPVLTGLAGRDVTLFLKEMGEFVVHASLPELAPEISAARGQGPGHSRDARAAAGRFGGYYLVGPVPAVSFPQAVKRPGVHEGLRPWPWQPGVDPFVLMVHSLHREQLCLVVDGQARPVTDEALGSWLRVLPELSASSRPLEDPLVLLTCSRVDARQGLADQLGRLVWFPHGDMSALFLDPAGRAPGAEVRVGLHHTQDGRGGRFTSVYPQGPAGDRVRWAYRSRFPADPTGWLVERSAPPGAVVPAGLRPYLFGGPRTRGLCYFDRRDHRSRFAALNARLGSSHVAWTPNHAYQPGIRAPIDPVTARPWHSRELGRLPFDLPATAVVAGYFADGRFAVYDVRQDLTYWETPSAFGRRLRRDLTAAGDPMPSRVLLLTDFDAVPALARQQIMPSLDGTTLITANTPATLFLDETAPTGGVPTTRIALLPAEGTVGPPVWTATTSAGTSTIVARPADIRVIPTTSDTRDSGVSQRSPGEELGRVRMPVPVGLPVPAVARSAGGKAALVEDGPLGRSGPQEWFEILDREGAGIVTYRVSSWGRIGIPGWANPVPGVGWAQWGHDLIHPSTGVVLRGHTGWIGRLTAAELPDVRSALAAHGAEQFTLSATPAGIFATPAGGGRVWQIPFHGHVRRAAPTTTPEPGRPGRPLPTAPELTEDELSMLAAEVQKELRTLRKPGMARMVVAREDVRAIHSHLDPSLWQHPLSKQGTKIAQYWVSGHQNGVQLPGAGQSVEAEWMNPIEVDPFGSDLEDDGSIDIEEVLEEVLERHGTAVLARCRGAEVTLDVDTFFQDDQGRLHTTEEGASASMVQPVTFGYPELVLWVMPHLPGEVRDISLEEGRAIYRMVSQAMAEVPGAGGDGPNTALAEVLRPQDGWEMTALGRAARIGPLALGSDRGLGSNSMWVSPQRRVTCSGSICRRTHSLLLACTHWPTAVTG
ncbi:hypothetical protein [Amycolatopsis sp. EV170708-02-1]|uniref:hypothetical protein n=1 Tax=Amycolatopsis sp. EV170708-02-1 TaxID=2919322 RepID=UPI001F0C3C4A|nr:hypothetical protein [Amycolatopsis sp. EV170708-02-1]UMP06946.1 hypothetical protein MJQ72_19970 [Amycolatopsis sp. EV170708-02-1]